MAIIRAQVRLPFLSGVPEDIATNTFHFFTTADPPGLTEFEEVEDRIQAAYLFAGPYLSSIVSRSGGTVRMYLLEDPEPRQPVYEGLVPLPAANTAASLPSEVALVLSFRGPFTSGAANARRRNRVYIGPLTEDASTSSSGVAARPDPLFMDALLSFGAALADDIGGTTVRWNVYSPTDGTTFGVIEEWVDNEFDTQRRRGLQATLRDSVTITQP